MGMRRKARSRCGGRRGGCGVLARRTMGGSGTRAATRRRAEREAIWPRASSTAWSSKHVELADRADPHHGCEWRDTRLRRALAGVATYGRRTETQGAIVCHAAGLVVSAAAPITDEWCSKDRDMSNG